MIPTVLAAFVSAWKRFAWYLDVRLLRRAITTWLDRALLSRDEDGLDDENGKLNVDWQPGELRRLWWWWWCCCPLFNLLSVWLILWSPGDKVFDDVDLMAPPPPPWPPLIDRWLTINVDWRRPPPSPAAAPPPAAPLATSEPDESHPIVLVVLVLVVALYIVIGTRVRTRPSIEFFPILFFFLFVRLLLNDDDDVVIFIWSFDSLQS